MKKNKSINIVLPFVNQTGGVAVILEYYINLVRKGYFVSIYYPLVPYIHFYMVKPSLVSLVLFLKAFLLNLYNFQNSIKWFRYLVPVKPVLYISNFWIKDGDCIIATAWPTAYSVARLNSQKGKKIYFIQGYEIWSGPKRLVDDSYRLPLSLVTISPWLTDIMEKRFDLIVSKQIPNGIDLDFFSFKFNEGRKKIKLLMMNHELPLKGVKDGLNVFEQLINEGVDIDITMFGKNSRKNLANNINYFQSPQPQEIVGLYQDADIFISPSYQEGWQLPPMEAMACGCAVIATEIGCIPHLFNGKNMLTYIPGDLKSLYSHLGLLVKSENLRRSISYEGRKTIENYSWANSVDELEKVFLM